MSQYRHQRNNTITIHILTMIVYSHNILINEFIRKRKKQFVYIYMSNYNWAQYYINIRFMVKNVIR